MMANGSVVSVSTSNISWYPIWALNSLSVLQMEWLTQVTARKAYLTAVFREPELQLPISFGVHLS